MKCPNNEATTKFRDQFGSAPSLYVRAPGRVNLIGEHIDYNQLTVLPMAIEQSIRLWVEPVKGPTVNLANMDPQMNRARFSIQETIEPSETGSWHNYAKAAAQALCGELGPLRGMKAIVDADLPQASGLSSSSALVVAVALALLEVNQESMDVESLAKLLARAERYTGAAGGGMDQAISLGGRRGSAVAIDFDPLRMTRVRVPTDFCFVVAFSGVQAQKSAAAKAAYNSRTLECREALQLVATHAGMDSAADYRTLVEKKTPKELLELATELPETLARRFLHVVSEAGRVAEAIAALEQGDRQAFGALMNASHESLRDEYEVSSEPLDNLVELAREFGADGARLTGAGFGGSIVSLVAPSKAQALVEHLDERYYQARGLETARKGLFVAVPSLGAESQWLE